MTTFRPISDRILVRPDPEPEKIGLIHIPELARKRPSQGVVVATGPGWRHVDGTRVPTGVQPGDKILYTYDGWDILLDGVKHVVIRSDVIGCILEDEAAA
jgi:chaperonin GroES